MKKHIAYLLIGIMLLSTGEGVIVSAKQKKNIQTRIESIEDGIKLKTTNGNLSKKKKKVLEKKLQRLRKKQQSVQAKALLKERKEQKKALKKQLKSLKKNERLTKSGRRELRKQLKKQRDLLRDINDQVKIDLHKELQNELTNSEAKAIEVIEPEILFESQVALQTNPEYGNQWGVQSVNVDDHTLTGMDNTADKTIVAVIDAGVDFGHPDLSAQKWIDDQCVDDQNIPIPGGCLNGGYDVVTGDTNPFPSDNVSHGTQVAALVGAQNNTIGMASLGGNDIQIMGVRACCTAEGYFTSSALAKAVRFAVYNGASVINMSLGGPTYSQELYDALLLAKENDVLVVVAAGNYGTNNDIVSMYPANYDLDNILTVSATNPWDQLAYFSNYGPNKVDIAAPGQNVWTTNLNYGYQPLNGTSFASPMVASFIGSIRRGNSTDYLILKTQFLNAVESFSLLNGQVSGNKGFRFAEIEGETTSEENTNTGENTDTTNEEETETNTDEDDGSENTDTTEDSDDYEVNDGNEEETTGTVQQNVGGNGPIIPLSGGVTGSIVFHLEDHLTGSSVDVDETGNIVSVLDYFPYGDVRLEENVAGYENDYQFTGKERDEDTGLLYYEARYYDSSLNRFIGKDPWKGDVTDPQSFNKYSYAQNNPVRYTDPTGESIVDILMPSVAGENYNQVTGELVQPPDSAGIGFDIIGFLSLKGITRNIGKIFTRNVAEEVVKKNADDIAQKQADEIVNVVRKRSENVNKAINELKNNPRDIAPKTSGGTTRIFDKAYRYRDSYPGKPSDYKKIGTKSIGEKGSRVQIHSVLNKKTGRLTETKVKTGNKSSGGIKNKGKSK